MDERLIKNPLGYWEVINKPTPEELQKYYADKYFQESLGSYESEYSPEEISYFRVKLAQRLGVINRHRGGKAGTLLDIGCGEGYNLAFFNENGWSVKGFDFSSEGILSKNPQCIDFLAKGDVYELISEDILSGKTYDVIWLQNLLEHVIDPMGLLESVKALSSPDTIVVITVPNDCSVIQEYLVKNNLIDKNYWVAPPDHLNYFTYESLLNICSATGWRCIDVQGDFPIEWYLLHPGSNYILDKNKGKAAHVARVELENLIHEQPLDYVIDFWSAITKVGFTRNFTGFFVLSDQICD